MVFTQTHHENKAPAATANLKVKMHCNNNEKALSACLKNLRQNQLLGKSSLNSSRVS